MDEPVERRLRDIAGDGTYLGDDVAEVLDLLAAARARVAELEAENERLRAIERRARSYANDPDCRGARTALREKYGRHDVVAEHVCAALARAGWLIPPNRRAALESVADVGWEVRCGRVSYGDFYRALDALNAEPALGQWPNELCGSWPAGWSEGESASCILPRGHTYDTCRSRLGGEWRRVDERTPAATLAALDAADGV